MEIMDILTTLLGVIVAIVGFMLKTLWVDIKQTREKQMLLDNKVEILEQTTKIAIDKLQHVTSLKFKQLNENMDLFCGEIKQQIKSLSNDVINLRTKK